MSGLFSVGPKTVIGLMSGTSVDSVDACCARMERAADGRFQYEILGTHTEDIPPTLRQRLLDCMKNAPVSLKELCQLNTAVGELFGETARALLAKLPKDVQVDAVASHGQTVYHLPPTGKEIGSTLQIGESAIIAEKTGLPVLADFRQADMAVGGQGAPLVPFADRLLFQTPDFARCVQNIGGIGNVTVLPPQGDVFAFDTGPGNMLIDGAMEALYGQAYDASGQTAATGNVQQPMLSDLLAHPYLAMSPPKTTGREDFGKAYLQGVLAKFQPLLKQDIVATLTQYTAQTIADAYARFVFPKVSDVREVIVGGGGVENATLMRDLQAHLSKHQPGIQLKTHEDFGVPSKYKEALAFAMLGWAMLTGEPGNVPACTGARQPAILGKLTPPPQGLSR